MKQNDILSILSDSPLFETLTEAEVEGFLPYSEEFFFEKGSEIITENSGGKNFYILLEGKVDIYKRVASGEEVLLSQVLPSKYIFAAQKGDFFGEMALFDQCARSANVKATTNVIAISITRQNLLDFCCDYPKQSFVIFHNMLKVHSHRIRQVNEDLSNYANLISTIQKLVRNDEDNQYFTQKGKQLFNKMFYLEADLPNENEPQ